MIESLLTQIVLVITAIFSNFLSAFSGGGAGLIQLPALLFLGLPFPQALATHKVASVALGLGASLRHAKEKTLDFKTSFLIIIFGIPGVVLGANVILFLPNKYSTLLLGLLTLFVAIYSRICKKEESTKNLFTSRNTYELFIGCIVLFALGFLNGSLTSGTGLFVTLWLVRWFNFSYKAAIAHTLVLVGILWNSTGAFFLGFNGNIKWEWIPILICGSLIGGFSGAHFSILKDEKTVRNAFQVISTAIGISLLIKAFSN